MKKIIFQDFIKIKNMLLTLNDPYNSDYDWTEEVDEKEMKREIPKEMYMALDGEVLESPNWEEGIPTALSEIMDKLCDALDE